MVAKSLPSAAGSACRNRNGCRAPLTFATAANSGVLCVLDLHLKDWTSVATNVVGCIVAPATVPGPADLGVLMFSTCIWMCICLQRVVLCRWLPTLCCLSALLRNAHHILQGPAGRVLCDCFPHRSRTQHRGLSQFISSSMWLGEGTG